MEMSIRTSVSLIYFRRYKCAYLYISSATSHSLEAIPWHRLPPLLPSTPRISSITRGNLWSRFIDPQGRKVQAFNVTNALVPSTLKGYGSTRMISSTLAPAMAVGLSASTNVCGPCPATLAGCGSQALDPVSVPTFADGTVSGRITQMAQRSACGRGVPR